MVFWRWKKWHFSYDGMQTRDWLFKTKSLEDAIRFVEDRLSGVEWDPKDVDAGYRARWRIWSVRYENYEDAPEHLRAEGYITATGG
jgi:hypothetical protein